MAGLQTSIIEFTTTHPQNGASLNGRIGFYKSNGNSWMNDRYGGKPAICISYHGSFQWMPIEYLSASNLKKYRDIISNSFCLVYQNYINVKNENLKEKSKNNDEELMAHLWSSYNPRTQSEVMQEILNQFPNSTFSKKTCSVCLKFAGNDKKKCMHNDCMGMCIECHKQNFGDAIESIDCESCPSCKKVQKSTCPICLSDKKHEELMYGDNCSHSICCKCFCTSFSSTPIVDCPLCRKNFKKTHWRARTGPNPTIV